MRKSVASVHLVTSDRCPWDTVPEFAGGEHRLLARSRKKMTLGMRFTLGLCRSAVDPRIWSVWSVVIITLLVSQGSDAGELLYNRDIRPILAENCFACHGPDSAARKADLRLDQRQVALDMMAIVPGNPEESSLIERIYSEDPDVLMPPASSHKKLTAEQKQKLRDWIAAGAAYQPHWSFIPPQRPPLPEVSKKEWVRNPIDTFILARLEAEGLEPAPEADRRTLIRRLSLDLTGLPPEPFLVEEFVRDPAPDAYEQLVDRLLDSNRWGEHRGRYWLDAARYADTHGIHFDNYREIWAYRDWVIKAFNQNMPFDQFTIEQLAGDLLPNPTLDQKIATGFHRCNITTNEGGIIDEEYKVLYARDRTETTATVWMGLTANCAVCHDHKFDPLSQREFYEMSAYFNNTTQPVRDGNIADTPPVVVVPQYEDRKRWDELGPEIAQVRQDIDTRRQNARAEFQDWLAASAEDQVKETIPSDDLAFYLLPHVSDPGKVSVIVEDQTLELNLPESYSRQSGHVSNAALAAGSGPALQIEQVGDFERDQAFSCGAWVKLAPGNVNGAVVARMDDRNDFRGWDLWVEGGRVGTHIIHKWPENAIKVVSTEAIKPGQWHHVAISYDGSAKAAGVKVFIDGKPVRTQASADSLTESVRTQNVSLTVAQRANSSRLAGVAVDDLRIYDRALSATEALTIVRSTRAAWLVSKAADQRSQEDTNELYDWWLAVKDEPSIQLNHRLAVLTAEQQEIQRRGTVAHVMNESSEPAMAYVLFRGEYDQRRDQVGPKTPDMLPPMPEGFPPNRLGLARWLLLDEHPLTARVTVNRFWQEVFGTGLVATAGDFGVTGEAPSHPELLDWLAVEFRESGWDIKRFFKLIVTSATYRQSAVTTVEKLEKDPANRLLARGPRFRMDAEMIRDYALAVSGLLSDKIGGPSVKPYQPPGVWEAVAMNVSNTRSYQQDSGESLYRRSLYTFWKRSAPPASMDIFNAPSRESCTVRRERTNTPLQALVTLNDPQFIEAARKLAEVAFTAATDDEARIDVIAQRLLSRSFRQEELTVIHRSLANLRTYYNQHAEDAAAVVSVGESRSDPKLPKTELAAWTMLCNQLMNLDEGLNK